jgi:hypothetical protein
MSGLAQAEATTRQRLLAWEARYPDVARAPAGFNREVGISIGLFASTRENMHGILGVMDSMALFVEQRAVEIGPTGPLFASDDEVALYNALFRRLQRHSVVADSLQVLITQNQDQLSAASDTAIFVADSSRS